MFKIKNFCMVVSLVLGFNLNFMHTKVNAQATGAPQNVQVAANVQTTQNTQNEQNKQTLANTNSNENETQQPVSKEKLIEHCKNYFSWSVAKKLQGLFKLNDKPNSRIDFREYDQQAEQLWQKVDEFVKQSDAEGITPEDFSDYIANFLKTKSKPMTTMSKADFENYIGAHQKIIRLYRGIDNEQSVNSFRNGQVFIGGYSTDDLHSIFGNGARFGHGIYTTEILKKADWFSGQNFEAKKNENLNFQWRSAIKSEGGIIEMAIDETKITAIDPYKLNMSHIAYAMKHLSEFNIINNVADFFAVISHAFVPYFTYHGKILMNDVCKKETGFSFEEFVSKKLKDEKLDLNSLNLENFEDFKRVAEFLDLLQPVFPIWDEDLILEGGYGYQIFEQNVKKPHYINKYYTCYNDPGLLARLLGYDVIMEVDRNKQNSSNSNGSGLTIGECLVVNPGILIVCNEKNENLYVKTNQNLDEIWNDVKNSQ